MISESPVDRPRLEADIVCIGFGLATAGFLHTLSKQLGRKDGTLAVASAASPTTAPAKRQRK